MYVTIMSLPDLRFQWTNIFHSNRKLPIVGTYPPVITTRITETIFCPRSGCGHNYDSYGLCFLIKSEFRINTVSKRSKFQVSIDPTYNTCKNNYVSVLFTVRVVCIEIFSICSNLYQRIDRTDYHIILRSEGSIVHSVQELVTRSCSLLSFCWIDTYTIRS